jgi:hypothetical protein
MTVDIATLGLAVDSRPVARARDELGRFTSSAGQAEGATNRLGGATDALAGLYKKLAGAYAAYKIADHVRDSAMLAARYETMGVVMRVAGNNAGYTNAKMLELQKSLQATGISMLQSRDALTQLSTANIDLSKATDLARIAQNLAVVANKNSSEALGDLIHGIKSGQSDVLANLGLQVSFESAYKAQAVALHTTTEKLTEHQKMVARTNIVMKEAASYNGIYEESLSTAGKQLASMKRYFEDLKVKAGEVFLPVLTKQVEDLTKALKAANAEVDKQGGKGGNFEQIGAGLLWVYDKVARGTVEVGAKLSGIIVGLASQIKGFGEASKLLLTGDFSKAWEAFRKGAEGSANATAQARAFNNAMAEAGRTAKLTAEQQAAADKKAKEAAEAKEQARIKAGEVALAAKEKQEKAQAAQEEADKKAKQAAEHMKEQYKELLKTIGEKTAAEMIALSTQGQLTEGQEYAAKVLDDLRTGVLKLSDVEKRRLTAKLEEYLLAEQARKLDEEQRKADEDRLNASTQELQSISEANAKLKEQIENYGLSTQQINLNTIAKLKNQMQDPHRDDAEIAAMEAKVMLLEEQNNLLYDVNNKERGTKFAEDRKQAVEQAMKDHVEQAKKTEETIDKTFHDGFVAMLAQGKTSWTSWTRGLVTTFKASVADELYKLFAKPFVVQLIGSFAGMLGFNTSAFGASGGSSAGMGSGMGSAGDAVSLVQKATSMYNSLKGLGSSFAGSIGNGISSLGTSLGSNSLQSIGHGMNGYAPTGEMAEAIGVNPAYAQFGQYAGKAVGTVGGYMVGSALNSAISGKYETGSGFMKAEKVATAIAAYVNPVLGAVVGAIGGVINRAFGMGPTELKNQGISGNLSAAGATGQTYQQMHQDGGWFRSDKDWTDKTAFTTEMTKQFTEGFDSIKTSATQAALALGVSSTALDSYSKAFDIKLTSDAAANEKAIADFFSGLGDEMSKLLVPSLDKLSKYGETAAVTLSRLADEFKATDQVATLLGKSSEVLFGKTGLESAEARERLIALAGGVDALGASAAAYAQSFMTEAEKLAPVEKAVSAAMASLGYASVTTHKQFKEAVDGLLSSGAAATEEGAKKVAGLLALAAAFNQVHPEANDASAREEAERTEKIAAARQALSEAYDRESRALQDTLARTKDLVRGLKSLTDSSKLGSLSPLTPEQQYAEARRQFEETAKAAKAGDTAAQDKYQDAYTAFLQASQRVNASSSTYEKDFNYAQTVTEGLADVVRTQMSDAQKQLDTLNLMVYGLVDINSSVLSVRDAIGQLVGLTAPQATALPALYQELLGRAPDEQGLAFWTNVMLRGFSLADVRHDMMQSEEYKSTHPAATIAAALAPAMQPVVDQLVAVQTELASLRAEQQEQTGDMIQAVAVSGESTATTVAEAVSTPTVSSGLGWKAKQNMMEDYQ